MTSNPSDSHSTEDTEATNFASKKPYSVTVELDGTVSGKDAKKWSSRCGVLVRSLVPISFKEWRLVDEVYMKRLWKALMKDFEINLKPGLSLAILQNNMAQYYRTHKYNLRGKFIHNAANKQDAIDACPDDIDKVIWEMFVDNEWDEKKKEQCLKNAENKAKSTISHALGRKGYNQVYSDYETKYPGAKLKRSDAWKIAHTGKDGNVLPNAQEKWDAIDAVEKKRKSMSGTTDSIEVDFDDFENDEITEVFGPDKKNRCRAMSSRASMKQVRYGLAAKEIVKQKSVLIQEEFQMRIEANIKATVEAAVKEAIKPTVEAAVKEAIKPILALVDQHSKTDSASNISENPRRTEGASNSLDTHLNGNNSDRVPNSTPNSTRKQYVMLCSREEKEVAKGYIANHTTCHGRSVARDERIVWVNEVFDPEAKIHDAPQDGNYKLCEVADGGFLIWLESRLKYL